MIDYNNNSSNQKLYINNLCISGEKIELLNSSRIIHKTHSYNKNINLSHQQDLEEEDDDNSNENRKNTKVIPKWRAAATVKLNVTDYRNFPVGCNNKQLRQIYETVKVSEFERILKNIYKSDAFEKQSRQRTSNSVLRQIHAEDIYQEFFGQHYEQLNNIIATSSLSENKAVK